MAGKMKFSKSFHVALLIESSRAYGRGLMTGVAKYVRDAGPWIISRQEQKLDDAPPLWLKHWRGDGIISRMNNPQALRLLKKFRAPIVQLHDVPPETEMPSVL